MAFPVPDHLPKRATPVDVSSKILYKIDSATKETLNSSLASSWIHELDGCIQETEVSSTMAIYKSNGSKCIMMKLQQQRIHDRIQSELPLFQHQLETSKSIQSRFGELQTRVDGLRNVLSDPQVLCSSKFLG